MRIGELRQLLLAVLAADQGIALATEQEFGGQATRIANGQAVAKAVRALEKTNLLATTIDADNNETLNIMLSGNLVVTTAAYDQFNALINQINTNLPQMMQVIDSFSPEQKETFINIKLPDGIDSVGGLQEFNVRLDTIFKKFNSSGTFKIKGFDVGSSWYQVLIDNSPLFNLFISSVDVALRAIEFRNSRKGSDDVRLAKKAFDQQSPDSKVTEGQIVHGMVEAKINEDAEKTVKALGVLDNRTEPETATMIVNAVKELIKEMDAGTEFHLSLNPPQYAEESNGGTRLTIDYSSIPKLNAPKQETKQLVDGEQKTDKKEDESNEKK